MKKKLCIVLVLAFILSLAGCVFSDLESTETNGSGSTSGGSENTNTATKITFEELTVVDNDACVIKITGIDPDNFWGYTLKVYLENKSAETTYMYSVTTASVNGVQADPLFATEVAAGKKSNEEINFTDSTLEEILGTFTDIVLSFRVYDSDDWTADPVAETTVHVYPYGEENASLYTRQTLESDTVIVDNDYVTVIVTGYAHDDIWGYTANLYLVNKTDTTVMFSADDVSVNGYMCDPFYACSVDAGNCAFSTMTWFDTSLEENGITEVQEIELTLRAYDYENWFSDEFVNVTVTLNP